MDELNYANSFEIYDEINLLSEKVDDKMPILTFSKLNKYFIIPFLCPIFYMISKFFKSLIEDANIINNSNILDPITTELSFIFSGLFYFITFFKVNFNKQNLSSQIIEKGNNGAIIYDNNNNKISNKNKINNSNSCTIIMYIILLSLRILIQDFLNIFINGHNVFNEKIYFLFFIPLFSKIILKDNIYKHQYFALIISIIGIIFLLVPICLVLGTNDIVPNILNVINGIIYPLYLVIIKHLIEKYYISPLKISLIIGIISLFLNCIGYIIYSLIEYNDLSLFKDIFDFSKEYNKLAISFYFIFYIVFRIVDQLLILLALFYFPPTLLIITDMIDPFLSWIIEIIKDGGEIPDDVLYPLGYIIIIFSALIYNEIIIFNFCGLNKDTKKFVNQRLYKELEEIKNTHDEIKSNNDDD